MAVVLSIESGKVLGHAQHKIEFADAHEHGRWHPASTMKPLLAWHALEAAGWSGSRLVNCRGEKPDKKGNYCFSKHGDLDLATAIATSCNAYFFPMAESLGTAGIKEVFHRAGLDSSTMTAQGDLMATALGHGEVSVSPLELALAYLKLARALGGNPALAPIRAGLDRGVNHPEGTANQAVSLEAPIMGKTGTGQATDPADGTYHGWFVGLSPVQVPQVVVAVFTHSTESAGNGAAPIAGEVARAWATAR